MKESGGGKMNRREVLKAGVAGAVVVGGAYIAYKVHKILGDARSSRGNPEEDKSKEGVEQTSKEEQSLNIQKGFLNSLLASDENLKALCGGKKADVFEKLLTEKLGVPNRSSKITDNDPGSLAGRKLIGWYNRQERLNNGFEVISLKTAINLRIHDIEQALLREQALSKRNAIKNISSN